MPFPAAEFEHKLVPLPGFACHGGPYSVTFSAKQAEKTAETCFATEDTKKCIPLCPLCSLWQIMVTPSCPAYRTQPDWRFDKINRIPGFPHWVFLHALSRVPARCRGGAKPPRRRLRVQRRANHRAD